MNESAATPGRPAMVEVRHIKKSDINPRGSDATKDASFHFLVQSVKDFGVLVPLLVRPIEHERYAYELIDGERRLAAAKKVNLKEVPAYIIVSPLAPGATRDTMFHIHRNRQSWGAAEECFALEGLYQELCRAHGDDESAMVQELVRRAGLHPRTARNRVQFLRWPPDLKRRVYDKDVPYWFIVELEDKIVEPAQRNFPLYFDRVAPAEVRRLLFDKWDEGIVDAARDVRASGIIAKYNPPKAKREQAAAHLKRLIEDRQLAFDEARERFVTEFPDAVEEPPIGPRALLNRLQYLGEVMADYDERYILEGYRGSKVDAKGFTEVLEFASRALQDLLHRTKTLLEQ